MIQDKQNQSLIALVDHLEIWRTEYREEIRNITASIDKESLRIDRQFARLKEFHESTQQ